MNGEALTIIEANGVEKPSIKRLSHTHEDIARWLLENPTRSLGECARAFGYTQSWLSCIIHSDAFQARLRKLQDGADAVTILDVPARLRGVAAAALDGLAQQVDHALQPSEGNGVLHRQFLLDTAEIALKSLGYGAPKATPAPPGPFFQQNITNITPVAPQVLDRARERLLNSAEVVPVIPEASQLPASGESDLRQVQRQPALVSPSTGPEGPETPGVDL